MLWYIRLNDSLSLMTILLFVRVCLLTQPTHFVPLTSMVFVSAYSSDVLNCFLLLKAGAENVVNISTNCLLGSPTKQKYPEQYKRKRLDKVNISATYHFLSIRLICRVGHYFYLFNANSLVVCQTGMTSLLVCFPTTVHWSQNSSL